VQRRDAGAETLTDVLRARSRELHTRAERSGIVADMIRGRADRRGYALLLRNLLPAYRALEAGLERTRPTLGAVAARAVYRADALESDLRALCGDDAADALPLLPAGERYAQRVSEAGAGDGTRLIAHAYTRYLGDLNGGRVLARLLGASLGLGAEALSFYAYPEIADLDAFRADYRRALDDAGERADLEAVVAETLAAFRLNIDVSEEVQRRAFSSSGAA